MEAKETKLVTILSSLRIIRAPLTPSPVLPRPPAKPSITREPHDTKPHSILDTPTPATPSSVPPATDSQARHSTKTTYRKITGFNIEVADSGDTGNSRVLLFRHTGLTPAQHDLVEQAPGTRCLLIGGEATRDELRRALKEIGRRPLASFLQANLSGRTHHQLLAYLRLSSSDN